MLKLKVKAKRGHDLYDNYHRINQGHFAEHFTLVDIASDSGDSSDFGSGDSEINVFTVVFSAKMLEEPTEEFREKAMAAMQEFFGNTAIITEEKYVDK